MSRNHVLARALTATIAVAASVAPTAGAMPIDPIDTGITHGWVEPGTAAQGRASLPGPPTWPENPKPIGHSPSQSTDVDSDEAPWATIGLVLAGTGLVAGSAVAVGRTRRRLHQPTIAG